MKITCLGAGKSGLAAAKLASLHSNEVLLSEYNTIDKFPNIEDELKKYNIRCEFGGHSLEEILKSDLVICSPGIKPISEVILKIKENNIKLISEVEYGSYFIKNVIIGVTGTNGKTTTVSLIDYSLNRCGKQSHLLGNVGTPLSASIDKIKNDDIITLELSSYQLDNINDLRVNIAIFLNITEDHIAYHGSFPHYFDAKWKITKNQNENDLLILNADDKEIMHRLEVGGHSTKAKLLAISINPELVLNDKFSGGIYSDGEKIYIFKMQQVGLPIRLQHKEELMQVSQLALPGVHNLYNSMAAAIALRRFEITNEDLRDCLSTFQGVEHRLEFVRTIGKNDYINDSKATNVNASWYALSSYERPIIWLVGGRGDNDYSELLDVASKKVRKIIAFGEEANNIYSYFSNYFDVYKANDLEEAILKGKSLTTSNEVILFSPACKSFDQYTNFEERGQHFKQIVNSL